MTVEQIFQIVSYVVTGLAVILAVMQFIYVKIKGKKSPFISVALDFISETSSLMGFAEQMKKLSQEERKSFAKSSLLMYCENKGITVSDADVDAIIEILIKLTKTVNAREKDLVGETNELGGASEFDNSVSADCELTIKDGKLI